MHGGTHINNVIRVATPCNTRTKYDVNELNAITLSMFRYNVRTSRLTSRKQIRKASPNADLLK